MSTKALWKTLEMAFEHPNADGDVCRAARDELKAIEQAARFITALAPAEVVREFESNPKHPKVGRWLGGCELFIGIAQETK